MISYKNSINLLKKSQLKISDETVNTSKCLNRILASDVFNKENNPATDNAAFDGFAINSKDTKNLNLKNKKLFKIIGMVAAGDKPFNKKIRKFQTVEIMTGGVIPKDFNSIIPIEKIIYHPNKNKPKKILSSFFEKKGVSMGKVEIQLYSLLFFLIHFIADKTPPKGPRSS